VSVYRSSLPLWFVSLLCCRPRSLACFWALMTHFSGPSSLDLSAPTPE
jgi:hypothetical protein